MSETTCNKEVWNYHQITGLEADRGHIAWQAIETLILPYWKYYRFNFVSWAYFIYINLSLSHNVWHEISVGNEFRESPIFHVRREDWNFSEKIFGMSLSSVPGNISGKACKGWTFIIMFFFNDKNEYTCTMTGRTKPPILSTCCISVTRSVRITPNPAQGV